MLTIKQCLEELGYTVASDDTFTHIEEWEDWYKGHIDKFHKYSVYNGVKIVEKERRSLGMAKTVSEDWANLLLNEKVEIHTDESFDDTLKKVFEYNNFRVQGNRLIELAFAFGTGAFVEYLDAKQNVVIDYIRADMIYPLNWENGYINECAFGSLREDGENKKYYIQIHRMNERGLYVIENHFVDAESGMELDLEEGIKDIVETGSETPLFQIITPNIVNNIDFDSPMGISVFANAVPQLEGVDVVYDSYVNEFELGKRKIFVPVSLARIEMAEGGTTRPVFDNSDTTFYAVPDSRDGKDKIDTFDPDLRAEAHDTGMNKALALLSFKCGMGTSRYKFENGTVMTATEVISTKDDLYQSLQKHRLVVTSALEGLVKSIAFLLNVTIKDIKIDMDDSIIQDKDSERKQDMADVSAGVMNAWEYRAKWYGEDEETAKAMIPQTADTVPDNIEV